MTGRCECGCGAELNGTRSTRRFASDACRKRAKRRERPGDGSHQGSAQNVRVSAPSQRAVVEVREWHHGWRHLTFDDGTYAVVPAQAVSE